MKYDPLYLFENKRNRFEKFLKRAMGKVEGGTPREGGLKKAAAPVQAAAAAMPRAPHSAQAARPKKPVAAAAAAPDLISMATVP